jgi:hypothetical protein
MRGLCLDDDDVTEEAAINVPRMYRNALWTKWEMMVICHYGIRQRQQ